MTLNALNVERSTLAAEALTLGQLKKQFNLRDQLPIHEAQSQHGHGASFGPYQDHTTTMGWFLEFEHWPHWLPRSTLKHVFYGVLIGFSLSYTSTSFARILESRKRKRVETFQARPIELRSDEIVSGVTGLIGMRVSSEPTLDIRRLISC